MLRSPPCRNPDSSQRNIRCRFWRVRLPCRNLQRTGSCIRVHKPVDRWVPKHRSAALGEQVPYRRDREISRPRVQALAVVIQDEISVSLNRYVGRNAARLDTALSELRINGLNLRSDADLFRIAVSARTNLLV